MEMYSSAYAYSNNFQLLVFCPSRNQVIWLCSLLYMYNNVDIKQKHGMLNDRTRLIGVHIPNY